MNFLNEKIYNYRLVLASRSPRRQHLLNELGLDYEVLAMDADESYPVGLKDSEIALYLCEKKADEALRLMNNPDFLIITADTIVWHRNRVLSKPVDEDDAKDILSELSGSMHEVITGVCLTSGSKKHAFHEVTKVFFRDLTPDEINFYVNSYKPFDKAGAYGIQEWIGLMGVKRIEGCYFNVMGLPVPRLYEELLLFLQ